jgi:hypothetical protein
MRSMPRGRASAPVEMPQEPVRSEGESVDFISNMLTGAARIHAIKDAQMSKVKQHAHQDDECVDCEEPPRKTMWRPRQRSAPREEAECVDCEEPRMWGPRQRSAPVQEC